MNSQEAWETVLLHRNTAERAVNRRISGPLREDLIQEVLIKLHAEAMKWNGRVPIKHWLTVQAKFHTWNALSKSRVQNAREHSLHSNYCAPNPEEYAEVKRMLARAETLLTPRAFRLVIDYAGDVEQKDSAAREGLSRPRISDEVLKSLRLLRGEEVTQKPPSSGACKRGHLTSVYGRYRTNTAYPVCAMCRKMSRDSKKNIASL